MELDRLLQLFRSLAEHQVEYVLVGGVAMNLHGLVRGTDDVDLFIRPKTSIPRSSSFTGLRFEWLRPPRCIA